MISEIAAFWLHQRIQATLHTHKNINVPCALLDFVERIPGQRRDHLLALSAASHRCRWSSKRVRVLEKSSVKHTGNINEEICLFRSENG